MREGGFGFHEVWINLPKWFKGLNIEALKRKAGIKYNSNYHIIIPVKSHGIQKLFLLTRPL